MVKDKIFNEECLSGMKRIPDGSVDMVLCDLPYGITAAEWDKVIDFEELWKQYNRVCKKNAAVVLFAGSKFAVDLIISNRKNYRYKWIWDKGFGTNFQNARKMPFNEYEEILVFYTSLPTYNPQWFYLKPYKHGPVVRKNKLLTGIIIAKSEYGSIDGRRYPKSILRFNNILKTIKQHPTQKPVDLLEYLIKTYTNEGETVLDNTCGSGSTLVAAVNTNRRFIGFELDENYYKIAEARVEKAKIEYLNNNLLYV